VVAAKSSTDLAVLKSIDDVDHNMLKISTNDVQIGTEVHILGHPVGMEYTYMKGIVSQVRKFHIPSIGKKLKVLHVTSLVWRGNSGGPAVDGSGHLVGVASFIRPGTPGMSFFVHKDELIKLLDKADIKYY
jgi:S1-C subfamily serine protease